MNPSLVMTHEIADETNACLAALSPAALAKIRPHMIDLAAAAGTLLWEAGAPSSGVFFPRSGLISIVVPMRDGSGIEVASVGRESAAGAFHESHPMLAHSGRVCIGGSFGRISTERLLAAAEKNREIRDLVNRCRAWLLVQAQQLAACNSLHSAERRFARWLLLCSEKLGDADIMATQEQIAALLGFRRTTLSFIAQTLHEQGLIDYRRGKIKIVNTTRLKAASCECYGKLNRHRWPSAETASAK